MKTGQPAESTPKPNIKKGPIYYELLKSGQATTGNLYRTQLIRLKQALAEKREEYAARHETVIFQHENDRSHFAMPVKKYLE